MKINNSISPIKAYFKDLKPGDTFIKDGQLFIKTQSCDSKINAVYLSDGHGCWIASNNLVTPIDAEVVIRG